MAKQDGRWTDPDEADRCSCKVGRGIEKYEIEGLHGELARAWTEDGVGLRRLADRYNDEVVRQAMRGAGVQPLEGEYENIRRLLTDADVTEGMRVQLEKRFESYGIDAEELLEDFVSYQTIKRHLRGCLDVDGPTSERSSVSPADAADRIFGLERRTEAVVANTLDQLKRSGHLELGEFDVMVSVTVNCADCGDYREVQRILERGCRCERSDRGVGDV